MKWAGEDGGSCGALRFKRERESRDSSGYEITAPPGLLVKRLRGFTCLIGEKQGNLFYVLLFFLYLILNKLTNPLKQLQVFHAKLLVFFIKN